ncbi:MAG: 50S ribosomal protein L15 [Chitinophagales bacterium]|nr:MAG: 50S ribosomal protein L15 [Chitinophagales bacterium]
MDLSSLKPAPGSVKRNVKRLGRGQGSGRGGTSTKGHKGAQSRSGYKTKIGYEGGQMPLQRRVPKVGFKNIFRTEYTALNLDTLQKLAEKHKISRFDLDTFKKLGLIKASDRLKILGRGELKSKIDFEAHAVSASAQAAIEKAGGTVTLVKYIG